ncbi:TM1812 family CRISPR-associated protein [Spirochaeta dissipatitropha]
MKKFVISTIPLQDIDPLVYTPEANSKIDYDKAVRFPVNAVLASDLTSKDSVKVVLLTKDDVNGDSKRQAQNFRSELYGINNEIGADIEILEIDSPFEETKTIHDDLFRRLLDILEDDIEITADITYGPKTSPLILFCLLQFAEKFHAADIKNIIYGKVDFIDTEGTGVRRAQNGQLSDITSLYYLNSLMNSMDSSSATEAVKMLDTIFSL